MWAQTVQAQIKPRVCPNARPEPECSAQGLQPGGTDRWAHGRFQPSLRSTKMGAQKQRQGQGVFEEQMTPGLSPAGGLSRPRHRRWEVRSWEQHRELSGQEPSRPDKLRCHIGVGRAGEVSRARWTVVSIVSPVF